MIEHVQVAGVRRWHGDEFVNLQKENLDVLQAFFKPYGACIIDGCTVTTSGSNYVVSAGLVAINHADGFKVARFAGASFPTASTQAYITISKSQQNKLYNDGNNKLARNIYTATLSTTAPGGGVDYILITASGGKTFTEAFVGAAFTGWSTLTSSNPVASGTMSYNLNKLTKMLHLKATLTITASATPNPPQYHLIFTMPAGFIPADHVPFKALVRYYDAVTNNYVKDVSGTDYIKDVNCELRTTGYLYVGSIKPESGVSSYQVSFNVAIPLI